MFLGLPNYDPNPNRQHTFFFLIYGCEAVIPLEIQILSLRVALATKMTKGDNDWLHLQELEALDERRLQAQQHMSCTKLKSRKSSIRRLSILERRLSFSRQTTHGHDTQN